MTDSRGMQRFEKRQPTPEALRRLRQLGDRLIEAPTRREREHVADSITELMTNEGIPVADFVAECGRLIAVKPVKLYRLRVRPGREDEAAAWLAGRNMHSAVRQSLRAGRDPRDLFEYQAKTIIRPSQ